MSVADNTREVRKSVIKADILLSYIKVGERFREDLGDVEGLAASIAEVGLIQPLAIDEEGNLLAGGRRFAACQSLGLKKVPVVVISCGGREVDQREIELIENTQRKDLHWLERSRLEKRIFDLRVEKDPSWSQRNNAELLDQSVGTTNRRLQLAVIAEAVPELANMSSEKEAWKYIMRAQEQAIVKELASRSGGSKIYKWASDHYNIGDALAGLKELHTGVIHFAEVDPPYAVDLKGVKKRAKDPGVLSHYTEITDENYPAFIEETAKLVYRSLSHNAFCVWWFGCTWYKEVRDILRGVGFGVDDVPAIWYKVGSPGQTAFPNERLGSSYENFFVARKGRPALAKPGR